MCQVLGVPASTNDVDVVTELRSRLEAAGLVATSLSMTQQEDSESVAAAVAAEAAKHEATISELKSNNEVLRAKLKAIHKSSQDAKQRHSKDVAKLQKTVAELQQRVRADKQSAAEAQEKTARVRSSAGGTVDFSADVAATSADSRAAGTGVVLPPVSSTSRPAQAATSNVDRDQNSSTAAGVPTSPVAMPPIALHKTSPTVTTTRSVPPTTAVVLPNLATTTDVYTDEHTAATSLRSQVSFFRTILICYVLVIIMVCSSQPEPTLKSIDGFLNQSFLNQPSRSTQPGHPYVV